MSKENEVTFKTVLWSDGSARPTNPGYTGWSVHGYVYSNKETKKGAGHPKVAPTENGYVDKTAKPEPIDLVNYYDYMGWSGVVGNNNAAEIMSIASALKYASTIKNLTHVTVYCDNKYAVRGTSEFLHQWVANGWKKRDGTDVANQPEWREVLTNVNQLAANKTKIKVEWVKGHADNFGNVQADSLATIAGCRSMIEQTPGVIERITDATGYWKPDAERHPMIGLRGLLFQTDAATNKEGEYFLTNQVKSHEFIGRGEVSCSFAYVSIKESDRLLEVVRKRQLELSRDFTTLVLMRTDRVYDKAVCTGLSRFGDVVLRRGNPNTLNMHFVNERAMTQPSKGDEDETDGLPITEELYPPRLALRCIETISVLKGMVEEFKKAGGPPKFDDAVIFDITKHYFDDVTTKEGVLTTAFKKTIGVGDQSMTFRLNAFGKDIDFQQVFGIHMLLRNSLKRLEGTDVKIWLVAQKISAYGVRYHTVIQSNEDWCAYSGNSSNLRIFKDPL